MLIKKPNDIKASEITDKALFLSRRRFLAGAAVAGATIAGLTNMDFFERSAAHAGEKLSGVQKSRFSTTETLTPLKDVTTYNNFYEFGTDKYSPAQYAKALMPRPWTVAVEGEIKKPKRYDIDELMKLATLEERVYRLRCVEGWSMVIPWIGFPLNALIKQVEPTSKAKYVEFTTLLDPKQMPEQKSRMVLDWPYIEGLRIDEANNPLAILCVGLYGEVLPNQNGAPIRMIVPWKYGFKSVKSIVKIRFVEQQPTTTWMKAGPTEYGFYSNVNPEVDHPRWSQARERRIGEFIKRKTLMFNGYGDQVASMYQGMDLRKYF
jgi:methionine sulfoxide reductase catalytic subunit